MNTSQWNNTKNRSGEKTPPRSRLYSLVPLGLGTAWVESLTSYINRLARVYRVNPRVLVSQEIVPHLDGSGYLRSSSGQVGAFCRSWGMRINGTGETAQDWAETLERLTMRTDLRYLALRIFTDGLPARGLPRSSPAWCPVCYQEWRETGHPIYQPLLWMLQTMTICPQHRRHLVNRCPQCQKRQSPVASHTQPGECTQCGAWLGEQSEERALEEVNNDTLIWQQWVVDVVGDLYQAVLSTTPLPWSNLSVGLAACVQGLGHKQRLIDLTNVTLASLNWWLTGTRMPSFERLLDLCYALDISPLHLITSDSIILQQMVRVPKIVHTSRPKHTRPSIDRKRALEFIQAVLDGREPPLGIREIERHLGLGHRTLVQCFPQECALATTQYQAHRTERAKQRIARVREEVRRVTLTLHTQGTIPGFDQVRANLSDPNMLRTPEGLTAWHSTRRELGIESENALERK